MKKLLYILCFLSILTGGCKKENSINVNQDKIYCEFSAIYTEPENTFYAQAKFRNKGATGSSLKLTSPSNVSFNGQTMYFNESLALYELLLPRFADTITFVWVDTKEKKYTVTSPVIKLNSELPDTVSTTNSFNYNLQPPVSFSETVLMSLKPLESDKTLLAFTSYPGDTTVFFTYNQVSSYAPGLSTLYADRVKTLFPAGLTSVGGKLTVTYRRQKNVVVK